MGLASQFGAIDLNNPNESHVGAWDNDIISSVGVALPASTLEKQFGSAKDAFGQLVEVQNPKTGKSIIAPIVDIGPGDQVINRQGPTIDLTAGAVKELGHSGGLDQAKWKFVDEKGTPDAPEGLTLDGGPGQQPSRPIAASQGQPTGPAPEGLVLDEQLKIVDAIDPRHPTSRVIRQASSGSCMVMLMKMWMR
jgi:hypothetical protein